MEPTLRHAGSPALPLLCWELDEPMRVIASASVGGGVGPRRWVINAQVPSDYARTDLDAHVEELRTELGLEGDGVGFLTAAPVERFAYATDGVVRVVATVGLEHPTWAAAADVPQAAPVGTINIVAFVPVRLDDAALVNAVVTVTEAKAQALAERGVPGTGTASDALCVLCPEHGRPERFAGPRSPVGAALARAVHTAVLDGAGRR